MRLDIYLVVMEGKGEGHKGKRGRGERVRERVRRVYYLRGRWEEKREAKAASKKGVGETEDYNVAVSIVKQMSLWYD